MAPGPATFSRRSSVLDILITGGAGFIGSHLSAALLEDGHAVLCMDNLSTGARENLAAISGHPRFSFLEADVSRPLPREIQADVIFHLASPASVPGYLSRPIETLAVNSAGTEQMLKLAQQQGARLLYTSTSEIYGDPLQHPQSESYWGNVNPIGLRSCYDEGKRFGEALVMAYVRVHGVDARIVRIFNTYGPHSRPDDGRVIPNFVMQALRGEPITVYGDGNQTRSFCYVSDMVAGLKAALLSPGTGGEVFNLGNPDEYTMLELASTISTQLGSDAGVVFRDLPVDDPTRRCPDITKARERLGWQPVVDLPAGIGQTAAWFRQLLSSPSAAR